MERNSTFLQAYNCQLAVDEEHQVIVAHAVSNQSPDSANLDPILRRSSTLRTPSRCHDGRCGLLEGVRPEPRGRRRHTALRERAETPSSNRSRDRRPDEPGTKTADDARSSRSRRAARLRAPEGRGRTGLRPDHGAAWFSAIPTSRDREGHRRMVTRQHDAQPARAIQSTRRSRLTRLGRKMQIARHLQRAPSQFATDS